VQSLSSNCPHALELGGRQILGHRRRCVLISNAHVCDLQLLDMREAIATDTAPAFALLMLASLETMEPDVVPW
jgi:hypothetical protein